jgi:GNAT superfamily N-acetyltransferase
VYNVRPVTRPTLTFAPLDLARWGDLETLFGARGACGGCWCMWWHRTRAEFTRSKGEPNRRAMRARVRGGEEPGILAYADGVPVGWCAIGPRDAIPAIVRSRTLRQVGGEGVWSVTCFFVERSARGRGVSVALLRAAVEHARRRGARVVEGYPVEPRTGRMPAAFAWTGLRATFERAGFREVLRRSATRPTMRRTLHAR